MLAVRLATSSATKLQSGSQLAHTQPTCFTARVELSYKVATTFWR